MEEPQSHPGSPLTPEQAAERLRQLELEAARLRAELAEANSSSSEAESAPDAAPETESDPSEPAPQEPTEAERREAELAIQRYRLERTRGNLDFARRHLGEAQALAPQLSDVLEATGDDLMDQRKTKAAIEAYRQAFERDPKNRSAERKHAEAVFNVSAKGVTLAETEIESLASARSATIFSAIVPGLGQLALNDYAKGAGFLIAWILSVVWVIFTPNGLSGLRTMATQGGDFNPMVLVALFCAAVTWFASLADVSGKAKRLERRKKSDVKPPEPPVNLPY